MMDTIKKGILYLFSILVAFVIVFVVDISNRYQLKPKSIYKVYLDGKSIGNIKNKSELEDYINNEQKDIKEKYKADKVYIPAGVDIQKCNTYEKDVLTAKQVHNIIKEERPFTIKGYKITIKSNSEDKENIIINVLDKSIFDNSIKTVLKAFVPEEKINNFDNDTQPEIKETGSIIEDIYIDESITIKESYISADDKIFIDEKTLTKYLLFGAVKDEEYYTVKEGDTIDSIAFDHKLATEEFLIVNPEFTSSNNLLSAGQQVKVGLIDPILDVVVESHNVIDQESNYKTVTEYDASMYAGNSQVVVQGENGMNRLTTKIKEINGEKTNVVIVGTETLIPTVDKVVKVGTKSSGYSQVVVTGDWAWPTISQYYISSPFGYRWGVLHEALDIAGSGDGSPIYAANDGVVITSASHYSLGNYIVINHNNGYYTMYAHLKYRIAAQGQTVKKGQQIGAMGSSGNSTGTHLHFGLYAKGAPYRGGVPTNPLILFR